MSSATTMFEVGAEVLGYAGIVATWRRPTAIVKRHSAGWNPMLTIQQRSSTDDGVHTPAESVTIMSREGLIALRAAIDEALKEPAQ